MNMAEKKLVQSSRKIRDATLSCHLSENLLLQEYLLGLDCVCERLSCLRGRFTPLDGRTPSLKLSWLCVRPPLTNTRCPLAYTHSSPANHSCVSESKRVHVALQCFQRVPRFIHEVQFREYTQSAFTVRVHLAGDGQCI